ncbi:small multi-drug export protein [Halobacteria archaeon AArc-curdl1]|uniref:Small multi-drug export protein n=1 Tax=Natronosalvus hydrolyticus TaxID=2979988 RepID=A0AAP3E7I4_9EURY|nr:small multi-drug export protein [Halobacteria archaeon AArc-curdl1]
MSALFVGLSLEYDLPHVPGGIPEYSTLDTLAFAFSDTESWVRSLLGDAGGIWQYVLVFVLAAIPLLEILVVIPIGIAIGLDPLLVAIAAFAGNVIPIYGICLAYDRLQSWLESDPTADTEPSGRRKRATHLWNRYGLPGLALLSPVVTGVHLAAVFALGLGARARDTLFWMTASIGLWTVLITAGSVLGLAALEAVW